MAEHDFSQELLRFLRQANETPVNLGTKDYVKGFNSTKVNVSFGRGNEARVPWIAFLLGTQKVQKGIYPVLLYYKQLNVLILAYGVSETEDPDINWNVDALTIDDFLMANYNERPQRYGSSLFYNSYTVDKTKNDFGLNLSKINEEITDLVCFYKRRLGFEEGELSDKNKDTQEQEIVNPPTKKTTKITASMAFKYDGFISDLASSHLSFPRNLIIRFVTALCTKPFVILTGLSGSGKTKLAQAFAKWICEEKEQVCMVPVGADWTNREPLLGYPNALDRGKYVFPDNGALSLILRAINDPNRPYFLILDEMNLSHVERYFADFLSAIESSEEICLHPDGKDWEGEKGLRVPPSIFLPANLFIIGTVNIDETTYMFSPKVLDRANVIEFRVSSGEMEDYLKAVNGRPNMEALRGRGKNAAQDFVQLASGEAVLLAHRNEINDALLSFFNTLKDVGAEFGYRTAKDMMRYAAIADKIESDRPVTFVIDCLIMQKLLPKVHGGRRKLEDVLIALGTLCMEPSGNIHALFDARGNEGFDHAKYPISLEKIKRMYLRLMNNATTSYAEA